MTTKLVKPLATYERLDAACRLEKDWMNHRLGWLFSSQSILFAAYGLALRSPNPTFAADFLLVVPWLGVALSAVVGLTTGAAARAYHQWTTDLWSYDYGDDTLPFLASQPRWPRWFSMGGAAAVSDTAPDRRRSDGLRRNERYMKGVSQNATMTLMTYPESQICQSAAVGTLPAKASRTNITLSMNWETIVLPLLRIHSHRFSGSFSRILSDHQMSNRLAAMYAISDATDILAVFPKMTLRASPTSWA